MTDSLVHRHRDTSAEVRSETVPEELAAKRDALLHRAQYLEQWCLDEKAAREARAQAELIDHHLRCYVSPGAS